VNQGLHEDYHFYQQVVRHGVVQKHPTCWVRLCDGELHLFHQRMFGNMTTRHFSRPVSQARLQEAQTLLMQAQGLSIPVESHAYFQKLHWTKVPGQDGLRGRYRFAEPWYALCANQWLWRQPGWRVALLGGREKIRLIQRLWEYPEYREYLGGPQFVAYLEVPERFGADDPHAVYQSLDRQLQEAPEFDLCLVGIGMLKLWLQPHLVQLRPAVYVDVGAGLSALAGCVGLDRPHFGYWVNYSVRNVSPELDHMDTLANTRVYLPEKPGTYGALYADPAPHWPTPRRWTADPDDSDVNVWCWAWPEGSRSPPDFLRLQPGLLYEVDGWRVSRTRTWVRAVHTWSPG